MASLALGTEIVDITKDIATGCVTQELTGLKFSTFTREYPAPPELHSPSEPHYSRTETSVFFLFKVYFFKDFIYSWKGGRKRERNINVWLSLVCPLLGTWPATQACALTGNRTCDPFGLQASIQSTKPH